jgi:formate C-acetyltransferase
MLLSRGLIGLLEDARLCRDRLGRYATAEQLQFYEGVEIACQGAMRLAERFSDLASEMAADNPQREAQLRQVASVCAHVPAHPAETFHQALQAIWFMHELIQMEGEAVRSLGHFDRTLYPKFDS